MSLHQLPRHARLIIRGEVLAAQARLAFTLRRALFWGIALLFAGLGLVFVNMGLFAFLSPLWGPVWTPAGLGLINLALAALALAVALLVKPGADMALAEEIRNMAAESIETEIRSAPLMGGLGGGSAMAGLVLPAVTSIIGAMAKRRKEKA